MEKNRDHGLDLLRCTAILLVLLLHSTECAPNMPPALNKIFSYGWIGVDLFFVLSGFLIGTQAISGLKSSKKYHNFHVFWTKRWFRTLPLYFAILFVYAFIKPLITGKNFAPTLWPFLFFLQNYFPLTDFVQSWSICIEEQFYLILPFICFFALPNTVKKPAFWALMILISFVLRLYISWNTPTNLNTAELDYYFRFPLYAHFDGLASGLFLASSYAIWKKCKTSIKILCVIIGFLIVLFTCWYFDSFFSRSNVSFYFTFLSIGFSFLLVGLKNLQISERIFFYIKWISLLSYGAYLWNNLFIRVLANYFNDQHWTINILIFFILTHLTALITYYTVEKPFLRLRKKYLKYYKSKFSVEADIFHTHHDT